MNANLGIYSCLRSSSSFRWVASLSDFRLDHQFLDSRTAWEPIWNPQTKSFQSFRFSDFANNFANNFATNLVAKLVAKSENLKLWKDFVWGFDIGSHAVLLSKN